MELLGKIIGNILGCISILLLLGVGTLLLGAIFGGILFACAIFIGNVTSLHLIPYFGFYFALGVIVAGILMLWFIHEE